MYKFGFIAILIVLLACTRQERMSEKDPFLQNNIAQWISDDRDLPEEDSLFYQDMPAPLFRKEFKVQGDIESAKLFITAAGYYKALVNGDKIGKNVLDPAWTDYSKRIYYTEYDVTEQLITGKNCIGVSLGNGFYNPLPLRKWGRRNLREDTKVGKPRFIAKLIISYRNGKKQEVVSDSGWKTAYGPLIRNSVYLGVWYNAEKEVQGWNTIDFNDETWKYAQVMTGPGGKLQKAIAPPVQISKKINPVSIASTQGGAYIVDMGENYTGTYRIRIKGNRGDTIHFRFGERLYENGTLNPMTTVIGQIKRKGIGGPGSPDIAWQEDKYIIGNDSEQWFSPDFTYHTFRYMEITGLEQKPTQKDVQGLFMHSNVQQENSFESSSDLLNQIQEATQRTFLANLISVQSDCPAREKFGYGGDLNATSESFIYNFDMKGFYRKTVYDWVDAMNDSIFVDTAPYAGIQYCGISWESAFLTTQYYLYLYYNDISFVKEMYNLNLKWMDKVERIHPEGIVNKGLSDHESLEPVPVQLTGTCHYVQCARIMQNFALLMDDPVNHMKYVELEEKLKSLVRARYWESSINEPINRQTLYATLLYHEIIPENEIEAAVDSLVYAIERGPSGQFNTGIFGTKYVLETLSRYRGPQIVFDIVNSAKYPGWGYMIEQGATTIWETWKESDNVYSNCHPMFGSVTEWYYRWLAGIRPDPNYPGFKKFKLSPYIAYGLDQVNCTYHSPFGAIVSNWSRQSNGTCIFEFTIPSGTAAEVYIPVDNARMISLSKGNNALELANFPGANKGIFELQSGSYKVVVNVSSNE